MKRIILFFAIWAICFYALIQSARSFADFKSPDQVIQEFKEPGHIPQGLKPSSYHPMKEVLPQDLVIQIKKKKSKRLEKGLPPFNSEPSNTANPSPIPLMKGPKIPSQVDLRIHDSPIRNQWDGTCTAHGLIAGLENLYRRKKDVYLSTRYFWSLYRQYDAEAAIDSAKYSNQLEDQYWPQEKAKALVKDFKQKTGPYRLTEVEFLEDDVNKVVHSLAEDYPVYVAMSVPQDLASCRSTVRISTGVTNGGHAMVIVGYGRDPSVSGGGYFILKNSWGEDCGDHGYQYIPFGLCEKKGMYCFFWSLKGVL